MKVKPYKEQEEQNLLPGVEDQQLKDEHLCTHVPHAACLYVHNLVHISSSACSYSVI